MMSLPHIIVLDEELPWPLTSGKRIRTWNLLKHLTAEFRITYLCHQNPDADEGRQADAAAREIGLHPIVVDRAVPAKSGLRFYLRLFGNLFSRLPYSVATHRSRDLEEALQQRLAGDPPQLIHCEWTPYAETLRHVQCSVPWVVMAHNVESLIWQRYAETEHNMLKRWYIRGQQHKFERFEKWACDACTTAIAVSEADAGLLRSRFGARNVAVVDNGVDTGLFAPPADIVRDPFRALFLGSLDWRPNLDAVRVLLEEIFPRVHAVDNRAKLWIIGRHPPPWLRERAGSLAGVELHANVADVRPFLHAAGLMTVPLRIGGGSRLKILEALAAGLPVIATCIGAEGLHLTPDVHYVRADSVGQQVEAWLKCMQDPAPCLAQAKRGRDLILDQYDWHRLARLLAGIWRSVIAAGRATHHS